MHDWNRFEDLRAAPVIETPRGGTLHAPWYERHWVLAAALLWLGSWLLFLGAALALVAGLIWAARALHAQEPEIVFQDTFTVAEWKNGERERTEKRCAVARGSPVYIWFVTEDGNHIETKYVNVACVRRDRTLPNLTPDDKKET